MRRFQQVDVFSPEPLRGNPVAVVIDGDDLSTEQMERFTRWTNLSEATFLLPPTDPAADYRVRIFTAAGELPFAGHPTLGSCHAWLRAGGQPRRRQLIMQECEAGLIPVRRDDDQLAFRAPPLRRSGPVAPAHLDDIARTLGIGTADIVDSQWVDNGPGWVAVLLASAAAVLAITPALVQGVGGRVDIGIVGPCPPGSSCAYEVRAIFSGDRGELIEDPVTGSLNASLAQWLIGSGLFEPPYVASQGEPRQVRKEAALSAARRVPRTGLVRADRSGRAREWSRSTEGARQISSSVCQPVLGRTPRPGGHRRRARRPMTDIPTTTLQPSGVAGQALYRRFRAQTFSEIVGQDAVVQTLRNAVRLGRVGHGFLFVGPRGTGKTSMARIMAKAVNCTDLRDGEPCDACPSCVAIREGRALDVIELDAASNNKVDDMRELVPRVYTGAADLARKVFIIDEVQRIKEGWDVLLKTLEEPPEGVHFIFCTTDPSQIRPAVVSRLQRFTFRPLSVPDIEGKLTRILEAERRTVEPEAIALVARMAGGGMRDAESMLDQVLASADDPISAASIGDLLGLADVELVDGFIDALTAGDVLAGIAVLDGLETEGRDLVAFSEQLVTRLRVLLVERMSRKSAADRAAVRPLARAARRLTGIDASRSGLGGYRWQLELCLLAAADDSDARVAPPTARTTAGQPAEPTSVGIPAAASPEPAERPATPSDDQPAPIVEPSAEPPAAAEVTPSPTAAAGTRSPAAAAAGGAEGDIAAIREAWPSIVASIGSNPANRPLVTTCRPVEYRDGLLVLGFPEDQAFMRDIAERKRSILERGIASVVGRSVAVRCVVTNLELVEPVESGEGDLVSQARRIFDGELAEVEDID